MSSIKIDVDYSSSSSAEVKNDWSCASASTMCPHDVDKDSCTCTVLGESYLPCISLMFVDPCIIV
jgi:hypothetical protein